MSQSLFCRVGHSTLKEQSFYPCNSDYSKLTTLLIYSVHSYVGFPIHIKIGHLYGAKILHFTKFGFFSRLPYVSILRTVESTTRKTIRCGRLYLSQSKVPTFRTEDPFEDTLFLIHKRYGVLPRSMNYCCRLYVPPKCHTTRNKIH